MKPASEILQTWILFQTDSFLGGSAPKGLLLHSYISLVGSKLCTSQVKYSDQTKGNELVVHKIVLNLTTVAARLGRLSRHCRS